MKTYIILLLTLFFINCNNPDPLIGTWERFGEFDPGMRIKIYKTNNSMIAEIVKRADKDTLFAVGDIKWKNIIKVNDNKYEFFNLRKYYEQYGSLFQNRYEEAYLILVNDTIKMRLFSRGNDILGTEQPWKRINAE
jgi:hypothetical protein